jgi:hypothetical protein
MDSSKKAWKERKARFNSEEAASNLFSKLQEIQGCRKIFVSRSTQLDRPWLVIWQEIQD